MPDAVCNWPVTCVCRTDRASVEFAQVHSGRDGSIERGPFGDPSPQHTVWHRDNL